MIKLIVSIIATFLLSILAAIHYRMGGSQYYNTKARDLGQNIIMNGLIYFLAVYNKMPTFNLLLALIISIPLMLASLSSYWDFINTGNKSWWTWFMTGWFYGIAAMPFCFSTRKWIGFIVRTIAIALFIPVWNSHHPTTIRLFNKVWDGAQIEEFGRGFITTITTPLIIL